MREATQKCLEMIKQFEGCVLHAYKCLPTEKYYTIGYGHYGITDQNISITEEEAENYLKLDLRNIYDALKDYDRFYNFTDYEYDALVSFCYNLGGGIMNQLTRNYSRNKVEIADAILSYNRANGKILSGLVMRRNLEYKLFTKGIYPDGISSEDTITESTTLGNIVDRIIAGEFGNGEERKEKLYSTIQNLVNKRYN